MQEATAGTAILILDFFGKIFPLEPLEPIKPKE
jgi:hypothetical protein